MSPNPSAELWTKLTSRLDELSSWIINTDQALLTKISNSALLNRFSRVLILATYFGDGYLWGLLGLYIILFGTAREQNYVLIGLALTIVNIAVFRLVKTAMERSRPLLNPQKLTLRFRLIDDFSFPSGHATIAFGISYTILHCYPDVMWAPIGAYTLSLMIGLSRIFVREHFPSDVIGGALLGTFLSVLLLPFFQTLIF